MDKKLKKTSYIGMLVIIILIVSILIVNLQNNKADNNSEELKEEIIKPTTDNDITRNESEELSKTQEVNGLTFMDTDIIYIKGKGSTLSVNVVNNTKKIYYLNGITAIVKDKDGNKIEVLTVDSFFTLTPGMKNLYNLDSNKDLTKSVYTVEYKLSYQE